MIPSNGLFGSTVAALRALLLGCVLVVGRPTAAWAQGVNPRWEKAGTDFHPDGAWRLKGRRVRETRGRLLQQGNFGALNQSLRGSPSASSATTVSGVLDMPVVTFYFQDTDPGKLYPIADYQELLFSRTPPGDRPYTVRTFYESMSNGALRMQGTIIGWVRLPNPESSYSGAPGSCPSNPTGNNNCNGIWDEASATSVEVGFVEALRGADPHIDFGQFDNDGEDGIPNSGDDNGYIDVVVFLHSEQDGSCGGPGNNHIWPHRGFRLDFTSGDPSASGGQVKARDYIVQSAVGGLGSCTASERMPIGTIAHELGHALGLPDLYDTGRNTEGIGQWGLMGAGNHTSPLSPARMEAWSLAEMGWVNVIPLTSGSFSFGAAPVSDTAFLVTPPGANPRGEHFLLENRQALEADTALIRAHCAASGAPIGCGGGLLIWHIDPQKVAAGRTSNSVNAGPIHGVDLIQADNQADLRGAGNRGDGGDPYPGLSANTVFGGSSHPAARLNSAANGDGAPAGFSITTIRQVTPAGAMSFTLDLGGGGGGGGVTILSQGTRPEGIMGHMYRDALEASSETGGSFLWALTSGALPAALTLESNGAISGELQELGEFHFTASASQGASVGTGEFTMTVSAPDLTTPIMISHLFDRGADISLEHLRYLDLLGNQNGGFDLGDFLAWVNATGTQRTGASLNGAVPDKGRRQ